jgi:hypothetical protein
MPKNPTDTNWIIGLDGDKPLYGTLSEGVRRLATADFALENPETTTLTLRLLAAQLDAPEQVPAFATGGVVRPLAAAPTVCGAGDLADLGEALNSNPALAQQAGAALVGRAGLADEYTVEKALAEVEERREAAEYIAKRDADAANAPQEPKHLLGVVEDEDGRRKARFGARGV